MVDIARPMQIPASRKDRVALVGPCARASLRVSPAAIGERSILGRKLDIPINTMTGNGEHMNVRLGPDEWLLIAPEAQNESIRREVDDALADSFFSLVDVSHRGVGFQVDGPNARDVLNGGCPLNLDEAAFPAGSATRTVFGKAEIVLIRPQSEYAYRIECLRSFGAYVYGVLNELMREFGED